MKPVIRIARAGEIHAVADVILSANPHIESRMEAFIAQGARWHNATPVVCEVAGKIVSCACIFHREVWVGSKKKRFGGIGAVATRPAARKKGFATLVMKQCEETLREQGCGVAILFCSIVEFYRRLGWTPVKEEWIEFVAPHFLKEREYRIEAVPLNKIPDAIRALSTASAQSAIVRSKGLWQEYSRWQREDADLFWAAYEGDKPVAYVRGRRGKNNAEEIRLMDAAADGAHHSALIVLLGKQCEIVKGKGSERFHGFVSAEHPLAKALSMAGIKPTWEAAASASGVMMYKGLQENIGKEFLSAGDFGKALPWQTRTWWAADRF
ncbi:MAG: GNAT family N-acetyltransferase [Verrucomicrobia bacterium]|nr:GNAT family N-acetyltransferase [Verrucomicrobiota bacterium]